jgi:hypothetical protein
VQTDRHIRDKSGVYFKLVHGYRKIGVDQEKRAIDRK